MSRPAAQSLQSRWSEWSRSLWCCRGGEAHSVNSMGGRLSRKKRGYNVNDPKEGKTAAESTEDPGVKDEPENKDASKEQLQKPEAELPEEKSETEAPKMASETAAGKQTDLTPDVKIEEQAATDVPATDLAQTSDVQESITPTNLVKATEQPANQVEHQPATETEVETTPTPDNDLSAEVPNVAVSSEGKTQTGVTTCGPNEETQEKPVLDEMSMTEASEDPSTEKLSLGDHVATKIDSEPLENSYVDPEDTTEESGKVQKFCQEMSMQEPIESQDTSLQTTLKEKVESSILETKSESGVECVPPKETEIPKLPEITEETAIDIVLKSEMTRCADLEKNIVGPDTQDEIQEKIVSDSLHPTVQVAVKTEPTKHLVENSDHMQDGSGQGDSNIVFADQSQLVEESGNLSVDTSSAPESVTDVVPAESKDPMAECAPKTVGTPESATDIVLAESKHPVVAESAPETTPNTGKEVTETRCEQTPELISKQDHVEIALLKTSSELIPDIKLTVCTETLQEEKMEISTELTSKESTDENFVSDATDPHPLNEVLAEKQSISCSAEMSTDQVVKLDPMPETISSPNLESPTDVVNTEETSSTKTENGLSVDERSQNESTSKTKEDNLPEASIANGNPVDNGVKDHSKSTSQAEVNGQSETTKAEENQDSISNTTEFKSIEQVNTNQLAEESGNVKLDNQTLDSGL
ncbi:uncharacterized protein LOC144682235 isoform X1 [Cetorhinus maximus]